MPARRAWVILFAFLAALPRQGAGDEPGPKAPAAKKPARDGDGQPLPRHAVARMGSLRFRSGSKAHAVAFSSDGKVIASGHEDGSIILWDADTGCAYWRGGDRLPSWSHLTPGEWRVRGLAFVLGDKAVASCCDSDHYSVQLWDACTGEPLTRLRHPRGGVRGFASGRGGELLVARTKEGFHLWDVQARKARQLASDDGPFAFPTDGKSLAFVSLRLKGGNVSAELCLLDLANGRERWRVLEENDAWVEELACSPDGKRLAAAWCRDKNAAPHVSVYDAITGKEELVIHLDDRGDRLAALAFSPDGKKLAACGRTLRIWDVPGGRLRELSGHCGWVDALAFSPDGKRLASGGIDGVIRVWEVATGKELVPSEGHQAPLHAAAFSPDGSTLYTADGDGGVLAWDASSGQRRGQRQKHNDVGFKGVLALAPDGRRVVSSSDDGKPYVWDASTGKVICQLNGHSVDAAFSPDGKLIAEAADDSVRLWDISTEREVHRIKLYSHTGRGGMERVAFAPDGKALAALWEDVCILWRTNDGQEVWRFDRESMLGSALAFSPDGRWLVVPWNRALAVLEVATGRRCAEVKRNPYEGGGVCLVDSRTLAYGDKGDVVLWDLAANRERARLGGHRGSVETLTFCPRKRWLATGAADTTAVVWDVAPFLAEPLPAASLSEKKLEECWSDLADGEAKAAYGAMWALARAGDQGARFLKGRLRPVRPAEPRQLDRWLSDLDDDRFPVREQAMAELGKLGEAAEPTLRTAAARSPSAEVRRRAKELLPATDDFPPPAERLREIRAIQALEWAGTAEAWKVLETLAGGAAGARTRDAQAALVRLALRAAPPD